MTVFNQRLKVPLQPCKAGNFIGTTVYGGASGNGTYSSSRRTCRVVSIENQVAERQKAGAKIRRYWAVATSVDVRNDPPPQAKTGQYGE